MSGSALLNGLRILRLDAAVAIVFANGIFPAAAQTQGAVDFASLIRTPAAIQSTLEHCDGHPDFETALAGWLEIAEPSSPADRRAVRETSIRLLEDTTDRQVALALIDGLLRHALEDLRRDETLDPKALAYALYADIGRAVKNGNSKSRAIAVPAHELGEGGAVKVARQAGFLAAFLKLAEPRVAHVAKPSQSPSGESAHSRPEQSDQQQSPLGP